MKKLFTFLIVPIWLSSLLAQSPEKMSYQAVVRNSSNQLVINSNIGMQISILHDSLNGEAIYVERHFPSTNANGLVSIEIGTGYIISGTFASIDWANGPYFIKTETDLNGGANYTITGTSQLLSVPYALFAKTTENALSRDYNDLTNKPTSITDFSMDAGAQNITNLADPANAQDAVTKAYVDAVKESIYNEFLDAGLFGIIKDIDGNSYTTKKIGTQVWMAENLKVTKYNDSTAIPLVTSDTGWSNKTTGAYCWYNNNETVYKNVYGALYNWHTASNRRLCPKGWHVPSAYTWQILIDSLGGSNAAGGKLKETGTIHWTNPNTGASNESGFTALPGGERSDNGNFMKAGDNGFWWSSVEYDEKHAFGINMNYNNSEINSIFSDTKKYGFSVRCMKD